MNIINQIIAFSLRNKLVVLVMAALLVMEGVISMRNMDIDVFPDLTAPTVVIMTDAHGMAAEEVERLVTFKIETAINGAASVRRVRSASMQGYSFVWAEFEWGMDIYKARQIVSEKMLSLTADLPQDVTPLLAPQSSVMGEIMMIGLHADTTSMLSLRTLADRVIKPAILATGGVSQVSAVGGEVMQYQILADPHKMNAFGITLNDIERAGASFSQNSIGGVLRDYGNEYALRGMAMTTDMEQLRSTLVKLVDGHPVLISDVATLTIGPETPMGYASLNASPAVILAVSKQPDTNTLTVTKQIERNLQQLQGTLPADVTMDTHIFRQSDYIQASVSNVGEALVYGAVLAVLVLIVFLRSFRTTVISVVAIPLSLLGTFAVLRLLGMNINTMTLGGLCIAIGSLVDDAIIDVENVYKRLRQNHFLPPGVRRPVFTVVFEASKEIRASILNATLIIMVTFVPLFFLSGMEGRMLKPLGLAFIISLFMSLVVAMTVTPLLCSVMLSDERYLKKKQADNPLSTCLVKVYTRSLEALLRHRKKTVIAVVALLAVALVLLCRMGSGFLPDFNEGSAVVTAVVKPGVSLDTNNELGYLMERTLLDIPQVTSTARRTGRGDLDEHSQATNSAEIDVRYTPGKLKRTDLFELMRTRLSAIPGITVTIGQPLGHRIDHILSGTQANIAIKVFGNELSRLYIIGNQIKEAIEDIYGVVDVNVEQQVETPQIQLRADRTALARYGIGIDEFNHSIVAAFSGHKIGEIYQGQSAFDVVLKLHPACTGSLDKVGDALIDTPLGGKVPLSEVAQVVSTGGPFNISRENVRRKLVVSANVSGRDVTGAVKDIRRQIRALVPLPQGYTVEYSGQFESAKRASRTLMLATILSLVVIFMLLYGEFKNASLSAMVMISLPLSLIGGVVAIALTTAVVSIPAVIGFITLFGIATRNGILLLSRYRHLTREGMSLRQAVLTGSADRINPILMTALTSALALIPLVFNADKAGNEIQSPMAVVVLGGLLSSTVLNIYLMPMVYEWYEGRRKTHEQIQNT